MKVSEWVVVVFRKAELDALIGKTPNPACDYNRLALMTC